MKNLVAAAIGLLLTAAAPAFAAAEITEAKLGKGVVDRQIAGETAIFAFGEKAYYWFRTQGASGELLTITWKVNDLEFPVQLRISGSPWRSWASKTLHIAGDWKVVVTDAAGNVLDESGFSVK
jgi:hypothetical protein